MERDNAGKKQKGIIRYVFPSILFIIKKANKNIKNKTSVVMITANKGE